MRMNQRIIPDSVAKSKAVLPLASLVLILAPLSNKYCRAVTEP